MNELLYKLSKSKFRSSFKLKDKDIKYIDDKGLDVIKEHCINFIIERLKPKTIPNDGRQTPMRNHPVFIAQHATGTCCRECLYKWHNIPKGKELSDIEVNYIVNLIMKWIEINYKSYKKQS